MPFPDLERMRAAGLTRYPRYCRTCRKNRRANGQADRDMDERIGAPRGSLLPPRPAEPPPPVVLRPGPPARRTTVTAEPGAYWRGGFRPRNGQSPDAVRRSKRPSEIGGTT